MKLNALMAVAITAIIVSTAHAAPPAPVKSVELSAYAGRWYEIARTPNKLQRDCRAATVDYSIENNRLRAIQRCSTANGRTKIYRSSGRILDPGLNARTRLTFAGFWSQEYWVVDHDADWALVSDPSGRYLWVMSRRPSLPDASRAAATSRARALGFDAGRLEFAGAGR